jgi:hypothetical protein
VGDDWQFIATGSVFRSEAEQVGLHASINPDTLPNVALEPGGVPTVVNPSLFPITVPASYPGNTFGQAAPLVYNFPELGQATTQYVTNTYRLFANLKGKVAGWDLDATAGLMYAAVTEKTSAELNFVALQNVLTSTPNSISGFPQKNAYLFGNPLAS